MAGDAYFYISGTTTPATVYANQGLNVSHVVPLSADAAGAFPQVFVTSGTALKVDVVDEFGASLPGFPLDPAPVMSIASSAASTVTFAPITGNATTNVQAAIELNTNRHESRSDDVKGLLETTTDAEFRTELGLGTFATQNSADRVIEGPDFLTGTSNEEGFITPNKLRATINDRMWESSETAIAAGTVYTFNHDLGVIPDLLKAELVCKTADHGFTVGSRIEIAFTADSNAGIAALKTATQVFVRIGSAGPGFYIAGAGFTSAALDVADWNMIVRAFSFSK